MQSLMGRNMKNLNSDDQGARVELKRGGHALSTLARLRIGGVALTFSYFEKAVIKVSFPNNDERSMNSRSTSKFS